MNYTIGDFVIRVKNASLAKRRRFVVPYSKVVLEIGKVLVKKGFLASLKEAAVKDKKHLEVAVKFDRRTPVISNIEIISKPSLRIYASSKEIPEIEKKGRSIAIISTTKGIMIGKDAYKKGIGGEVLFKIW